MKQAYKPVVKKRATNANSPAVIALTPLEIAHIIMALEHDDCVADEVIQPLMAKLGYRMAIAYINNL
jgi:hypothetical protein